MTDLSQHQLSQYAENLEPDPKVVGFDAAIDKVVALLGLRGYRPPILAGARGCGRTAALRALRQRLDGGSEGVDRESVLRIDCARLVAFGAQSLQGARELAGETELIAFDDLDLLMGLGASTANTDMIALARAMLHDPDLRLVGTVDAANLASLRAREPELTQTVEIIELPELGADELAAIAEDQANQLEKHHGVALIPPIIELAARPPEPGSKLVHPGLLVTRLDAACVHARMRGASLVEVEDVDLTHADPQGELVDRDELAAMLRERVSGQEETVETVSRRLAMTSRKLDLNAHRPDGVFLFVGPTGVGKTEFALALAEARFGDEKRVIRLDMSEFSESQNISRLIGPPPGYIGSDEPGGWLTTRVNQQPRSVVLFDEIEKAHPQVWMTLLQILDAGRLTDGRGEVASFSDAVVIMTSNIGTGDAGSRPVGFAAGESDPGDLSRERIMEAVKEQLPPELVNRIDNVLVFSTLPIDVIETIAAAMIRKATTTLAGRGWSLEVPEEVVAHIARKGYDPAYGARHVKRAIEDGLLAGLAQLTPGGYRGRIEGGEIVWDATTATPQPLKEDGPAAEHEDVDDRSSGDHEGADDGRALDRTLDALSRESLPSGLRPVRLQASLRHGTGRGSERALLITGAGSDLDAAAEILVDAVSERIVRAEAAELLRECETRPLVIEGLAATAGLNLMERLTEIGVEVTLNAAPARIGQRE